MAVTLNSAAQAENLRLELKAWEAAFAACHGGQKPSREDIKLDHSIVLKYKAYANLKAPAAHSLIESKNSKRSSLKRQRSLQIPQKDVAPPESQTRPPSVYPTNNESRVFDVPLSPNLTPKHQHTCIGPTPQKDGIVLGLFDLLSPASAEKSRWSRTPSKRRQVLGQIDANCETIQTPSKGKSQAIDQENRTSQALTPSAHLPMKSTVSGSKRAYMDAFLTTPSKRRALDSRMNPSGSGASLTKIGEETPSFLRRTNSLGAISQNATAEGDDDAKPDGISWSPVRLRPKPFGRTLSALVQSLRQIEDDKADEDLDLLRELENDRTTPALTFQPSIKPAILVHNSQAVAARLGPDRGISSDEDQMEEDVEGKPGKKWKKKGQKRTTRKVNLKPTTVKWRPEPEWEGPQGGKGNGNIGEEAHALDQGVGETQRTDELMANKAALKEITKEVQDVPASKISKIRAMIEKTKAARIEEPVGKKSKIKVGALAHMNFRSLNIKNKNSKCKGKGGRFGRGR